jgi:hypothetical protein
LFDDSDELVAAVAACAGESDEFPGVFDHRTALGAASYADAAAAAELEQVFVSEDAQSVQRGVRIDAEHRR